MATRKRAKKKQSTRKSSKRATGKSAKRKSAKRKTAPRKSAKRKTKAAKRTLIAPKGDKRYVRRTKRGRFKESDDVSASLSADRRKRAKRKAPKGQGDRGDSMFVVLRGTVDVVLEPSGQRVATIERGGFFGEMSMLTGDPRTATVRAVTDSQVLEIAAADIRRLAQANPGLLEHVSAVVEARRVGLAQAEASAAAAAEPAVEPRSLLARIKAFLAI